MKKSTSTDKSVQKTKRSYTRRTTPKPPTRVEMIATLQGRIVEQQARINTLSELSEQQKTRINEQVSTINNLKERLIDNTNEAAKKNQAIQHYTDFNQRLVKQIKLLEIMIQIYMPNHNAPITTEQGNPPL